MSVLSEQNYRCIVSASGLVVIAIVMGGRSNRELFSIRSLKILQHVLNGGSINPNRITTFGWGKQNRRMDILFENDTVAEKAKGILTFLKCFLIYSNRS